MPPTEPRGVRYLAPTGSLRGRVVRNRFRINAPIGRGGMSTVYLARDVYDGELYAVKVLRSDRIMDVTHRRRFIRELRATRRVDHPAIVDMLDVGELDDGRLYLVMEYVRGVTLKKLVRNRLLERELAIPILCTIADGLRAAHARGVIHRDLKPGNVLIPRRSTPEAVVKIVDFGIARIVDAPSITSACEILGTPLYISPEQALGGRVDHRTDIYSLGVMMYEMFTGRLPFFGKDPGSLLRQHVRIRPRPLREIAPEVDIPLELEQLVLRCLAKLPADRPAGMGEILAILSRYENAG